MDVQCNYEIGPLRRSVIVSAVRTRIIKIGNSQGIRLPKVLLDQVGLIGEIQVEVQPDHLVLRPAHRARQGWEEQFQQMAQRADDQLLDPTTSTEWDVHEWDW
jgi:antitoxin MazE